MDYLYFSTLVGVYLLLLLISYDIACQWACHLFKRMLQYFPTEMHIDRAQVNVRFAIPKKHFRVHGGSPHSQFSFNYLRYVGRTYGEGIESHWSHMNPLLKSVL